MLRIVATSLVAVGLCAVQTGCCCCRLPMFRPPPVVIQQPPVVVQQPPVEFKPPAQKRHYVYSQSTGQLKLDNQVLGTGYSGKGQARNSNAMQATKDIGAIPVGLYLITGKHDNDFRAGRDVIGLLPFAGKCDHFNRFPGELFGIIPEVNPPNNPPNGCVVTLPKNVWDTISTENTPEFEVVP